MGPPGNFRRRAYLSLVFKHCSKCWTRTIVAHLILLFLIPQQSRGELRQIVPVRSTANASTSSTFPDRRSICGSGQRLSSSLSIIPHHYPGMSIRTSKCVDRGDIRLLKEGWLLPLPFRRKPQPTSSEVPLDCLKEVRHWRSSNTCASFIDTSQVAQMLRKFLGLNGEGKCGSEDLGPHNMKFEGCVARIWKEWVLSLPPVSRAYLLLCGATSASSMTSAAFGQTLPSSVFHFIPSRVLTRGEVWRLLTPLFYLGDSPISAALSLAFAYTYLPLIERHCNNEGAVSNSSTDPPKVNKGPSRLLKVLLWGAGCSYGLVAMRLLPPSQQQQFFFSFLLFLFSRIDPTGEAELLWNIHCSNAALPMLLVLQHLLLDGQLLKADLWGALAALGYLTVKPNL